MRCAPITTVAAHFNARESASKSGLFRSASVNVNGAPLTGGEEEEEGGREGGRRFRFHRSRELAYVFTYHPTRGGGSSSAAPSAPLELTSANDARIEFQFAIMILIIPRREREPPRRIETRDTPIQATNEFRSQASRWRNRDSRNDGRERERERARSAGEFAERKAESRAELATARGRSPLRPVPRLPRLPRRR